MARHALLRRLGRAVLGGGLAAFLAVAALPASAEEVRLSREEAKVAAVGFLKEGRTREALAVAESVLQGAPEDISALLLKSRALRELGRYTEAAETGERAWTLAADDRGRYFAAQIVAQALSSDRRRTMAQLWLRRAAEVAPDDRLRAAAVQDFRYVRSRNPWRTDLSFTLAPSDNINGAPKTNRFSLGGLDLINPAAVPLSGLRYGAGLHSRYTIPLGPDQRLWIGGTGRRERVELSEKARDEVPSAENGDYSYDAVGTELGYERRDAEGRALSRVRLGFGRDWRGGELYSDSRSLDLEHERELAPGWVAGVALGYEQELRHDLSLRDAGTRSAGLTLTRRMAGGNWLRLGVDGADVISDSPAVAHDAWGVSLRYGLGRPVLGKTVLPSFTLGWEAAEFETPLYGAEARSDREVSLGVDMVFPKLDLYGFAPTLGVSVSDRSSNFSLFESRSTDLRLGLRSLF